MGEIGQTVKQGPVWAHCAMVQLPFEPSVAGVDEAGRGPIAGPLVVAGVVLPDSFDTYGLNDSKKLTPEQRDRLYDQLVSTARYEIVVVSVEDVDRLNILKATLTAMSTVIRQLTPDAVRAVVDGNQSPIDPPVPCEVIVKGDSCRAEIAAASIIAKVTRDRLMRAAHAEYPKYGFDEHFGYYCPEHISALREFGPCPLHRRSFEPVKSMVNQPCLNFVD